MALGAWGPGGPGLQGETPAPPRPFRQLRGTRLFCTPVPGPRSPFYFRIFQRTRKTESTAGRPRPEPLGCGGGVWEAPWAVHCSLQRGPGEGVGRGIWT